MVHDPKAIIPAKARHPELTYSDSIEDVVDAADVILHLTEWKMYRELDPQLLKGLVKHPVIIDGRNALNRELWLKAGWKFRALGRSSAS